MRWFQHSVLVLFSTLFAKSSASDMARDLTMKHNLLPSYVPFVKTNHMPVNKDQWVCGGEFVSETLAYHDVQELCWEKMPEYNLCCAIHDSCYDLLAGRDKCDDEFCRCTLAALSFPAGKDRNCEYLKADEKTTFYCKVVRKLGGHFYGGTSDKVTIREHHPALNKTANNEYLKLYTSCPGFNKPASVCAYNHMVCTLKLLPFPRYQQEYTDCREQLIECVTQAAGFLMKDNEKCTDQLGVAIEAIQNDAKLSGLPESFHWDAQVKSTTTVSEASSYSTRTPDLEELSTIEAFTNFTETSVPTNVTESTLKVNSTSSTLKLGGGEDFPFVVVTLSPKAKQ